MPTRRHVRETAVQLIYSTEFNGHGDVTDATEAFWDLIQEDDRQALHIAQIKALLHLAGGRDERTKIYQKRIDEVTPYLAGLEETEKLRIALANNLRDELKWSELLSAAGRLQRSQAESDQRKLAGALDELLKLDRSIISRRGEIELMMSDLPQFQSRLETIKACIVRLQRISDRIQLLAHPEGYANQPQVSHLKNYYEDIIALRKEVTAMVKEVHRHTEEIDAKIAQVVENWNPERINPVDRCVLRIGIWEILFCEDIPDAVAINEALDIVRGFATESSHRFVNGVLDKVAKTHATA